MAELIEFDPVEVLRAGAFGAPGQRTFLIQASKGDALLSVLVEKEQVALLVVEAGEFLDRLADELAESESPEEGLDGTAELDEPDVGEVEEAEPLFRARLIGLGFDPTRGLVLLELRETARSEGEMPPEVDEDEGHVARLYASRAQVRAMVASGLAAVAGGRPRCPLCEFPIDPEGHRCPRWN